MSDHPPHEHALHGPYISHLAYERAVMRVYAGDSREFDVVYAEMHERATRQAPGE